GKVQVRYLDLASDIQRVEGGHVHASRAADRGTRIECEGIADVQRAAVFQRDAAAAVAASSSQVQRTGLHIDRSCAQQRNVDVGCGRGGADCQEAVILKVANGEEVAQRSTRRQGKLAARKVPPDGLTVEVDGVA